MGLGNAFVRVCLCVGVFSYTYLLCYLLTLSPPIPLRLYTLPYRSNPPFLIFDIRALWRSVLSATAPECQKLKNGGIDQYGAGRFEQQQCGTAGGERVNLDPNALTIISSRHRAGVG